MKVRWYIAAATNITLRLAKSEVNKRLSVTGRINFDYLKVYGAGVAGNGTNEGGSNVDAKFNKMVQILQYRPTIGIRGNDSDLLAGEDPVLSDADGNVMQNPLIAAAEEKDNKETRTLQANGGLTFKIIKGLTFRNNTGMRYQLYRRELSMATNLLWKTQRYLRLYQEYGDRKFSDL